MKLPSLLSKISPCIILIMPFFLCCKKQYEKHYHLKVIKNGKEQWVTKSQFILQKNNQLSLELNFNNFKEWISITVFDTTGIKTQSYTLGKNSSPPDSPFASAGYDYRKDHRHYYTFSTNNEYTGTLTITKIEVAKISGSFNFSAKEISPDNGEVYNFSGSFNDLTTN